MTDLRAVARVVRWGAESFIFNLSQLPPDKLDFQPNPGCKSALQVTGEAAGVMRMLLPLFTGGDFQPSPSPPPQSFEEAKTDLLDASEAFAAALDGAGPELERSIASPFGGEMWVAHAVVFGMIDLLHHHGQITYLQSLLGDAENHMDTASIARWFGPPGTSSQ